MKVTDFRLGNLYKYFIQDELDPRKEWWELCQMDVESLKWVSEHPEDEDYQPIPLTEEWLLKFGFEKRPTLDSVVLWQSGIDLFQLKSGEFMNVVDWQYTHGIPIKYVHQLQNLYFALTGEELNLRESAKSAGTLSANPESTN